nr:hypothetical protein [Paraburkholderia phosphatilytica]
MRNRPDGPPLTAAHLLDREIDLIERAVDLLEKRAARFAQRDPAARAVQQRDAEPRFERAHALRYRRRADAEMRRRAAEAAGARDHPKNRQSAKRLGFDR